MPSADRAIRRIGLTGGIGSGKSTVAGFWVEAGAALVDADAVSRSLTATGGAALPAIQEAFGADMIGPDGALDRQAMRERVFQQPDARHRLEAILHPLVGQTMDQQAREATQAGARLILMDIPLLVESRRWPGELDAVVVVDCLPETQERRVMERSGLAVEAVRAIMAAQASRQQRLSAADAVIFNDACTLLELQQQVGRLAHHFGL